MAPSHLLGKKSGEEGLDFQHYTKKKQEAKKILEMASSTVKKDKKLILTKTIIVNIVLSDGKNKKESTTINCKCIGAKMESKPSK